MEYFYLLVVSVTVLFVHFDYRVKQKRLSTFKGYGRLAKLTNDIDFSPKERNLFFIAISKIRSSNRNNFITAMLVLFIAFYLSNSILGIGFSLISIQSFVILVALDRKIDKLEKDFR